MLLTSTVPGLTVFGTLVSDHTYDHQSAMVHPFLWALLHGLAVLLAATFQVVA
ncbi:hypothetical protein [Actinoplanes auranticolor]|uniref:Uncharacterized protein n=1 Tax=Actinoplanes auranticolor TaxID=47988 RepID=A0A919VLM5_9ACTN|nr:hypothetical protein [Actinoplanes auranticolor]GIM67894.1 hypothetical protein Aau02nite_29280 [Actinoplanes auranticolor]